MRWGLPGALALAGLVLLAVGSDTSMSLGIALIGIAAIVAVWNAFLRLSFSSREVRAREQRARQYFSRHGHWPHGSV